MAPARSRRAAKPVEAFPDPRHDHDECVDRALAEAEALCAARGERLTSLRRRVLELVWAGHRPVGAYAILERMRERGGRKPAPPTVYRALDFLRAQGLVHRIESLNAFVGCDRPERPHAVQFMICRACRISVELHDEGIAAAIGAAARAAGFSLQDRVVELAGLCRDCASAGVSARARGGPPARP
jgi:Fur family zinc uptake transcriptional regulator